MHRRIAVPFLLTLLSLATAPDLCAQLTPPNIVFGPTNQTLVQGATARFQVGATGSPTLFYRWWRNGEPVTAMTTSRFLTISNVQPFHAGTYIAEVTNAAGSAFSPPGTLTVVSLPPQITAQPQDALLCPDGTNAFLSVSATGSLPLVYQWRLNGVDIPLAVTRFLTVPSSLANIGDYSVVITNNVGSVTSRLARVAPGIAILQQPRSGEVFAGQNNTLSIVARGCTALRYQWRFNSTPLPGAEQSALNLTNVTELNAGGYDCVVSDNYSSVTSAVATITVLSGAPVVTVQPADHLNVNDTNVTFYVDFFSWPAIHVQWRLNGVNIPGATGNWLQVRTTPSSEGGYSAVATNIYGAVTSRVATLTLAKYPPSLDPWGQPQSQMLCPSPNGNYLYVSPSYPVSFPPTYHWRRNETDLPGATASALLLNGNASEAGDYTVVIANQFGAITSEVARVTASPIITRQPESGQARVGEFHYLSCQVEACGNYQIQWEKDGVPLPGENNLTIFFNPTQFSDSGDYRAVVTHPIGVVTSEVARLEVVQEAPDILNYTPLDQQVYAGHWAYIDIDYLPGAPRASFQWFFNSRPIPGETNETLHVFASSAAQQGRYHVVLSNVVGVVTSRAARLTVLFTPPFFEQEPEDYTVEAGWPAYFFAQASGAPPPSYQWLFNDVPIPGETNENLAVFTTSTNHIGGYSVIASNLLGSITSQVARLELITYPPGIVVQPTDQYASAGHWISFACIVTSAPPAALQWYFNGMPIPNATNYYHQFRAGFSNQIGGYHLVAINELGAVTSAVARLTIDLVAPQIYSQPLPQSLVEGEQLSIYANVLNGIPVLAQWQRDGFDIPGATNNNLFVRYAGTNDSGDYRVIFWNDVASVTSQVARVEVRPIGPLEKWHWRRPLPQGDHLIAVAYGNGRHVAVGYERGVAVSTNRQEWFDTRHPTKSGYRNSICYGNGVFVTSAYAPGWVLQHSTNGVDWIDWQMPQELGAGSPVFGNGRFVARATESSNNGTVIRTGVVVSTNGIDWEFQDMVGSPWLAYLSNLQFAGDRFLATAQGPGLNGQMLYASDDGVNWIATDFPIPYGTLWVTHDGQRYVGFTSNAQSIYISTDGLHWTTESIPFREFYPNALAYGNGVWISTGYRTSAGYGIQLSANARDWTSVPGVGTNGAFGLAFDGTHFVAVGPYGFIGTSTNGRDWNVINPGSDANLRSITRADGLFVTVGSGGLIYTSPDGRDWTRRESGTPNNLRSVTRFKNHFIAIGESELALSPATLILSSDGLNWAAPFSNAKPVGNLYSLAHNGQCIVAVGDLGNVSVSSDGITWSNLVSGIFPGPNAIIPTSADLNAVTWTGDRFTAVGKDGTAISSHDGFAWRYSGPGGGRNLHGVAYGNGVHVIVANGGRTFHSTNGTSWTRVDLTAWEDFSDVHFANGRFIAVGDNGTVFTSTNGAHWTRRPTACGNDLRSALYADGSYFAVGNNETILQSAQVDGFLRILPNPGQTLPIIEVRGEIGQRYLLQSSSNLHDWFDIQTVTIPADRRLRLLVPPGFSSNRFFRLVSP